MGSYNYTCAISDLPIAEGDPVRYLLIAESPYKIGSQPYIHGLWWPRVYPLRARYDDYGRVSDVESPEIQQLWLDSLRLDMVEKGVGENTIHDAPCRLDQTFKQMMRAAASGRLEINPYCQDSMDRGYVPRDGGGRNDVPDGVPTLARVEAAIGPGYVVDREDYGRIRVRVHSYSKTPGKLEIAAERLGASYATMITKETGAYGWESELLVRPLPSVRDYNFIPGRDRPVTVAVRQIMIREDVWQALLKITLQVYWSKTALTYESFTKERRSRDDDGFERCPIPFSLGLPVLRNMAKKRDWSRDVMETFQRSVDEMEYVQLVLDTIRYQWRPVASAGPQYGEWQTHIDVLKSLTAIAETELTEREREGAMW